MENNTSALKDTSLLESLVISIEENNKHYGLKLERLNSVLSNLHSLEENQNKTLLGEAKPSTNTFYQKLLNEKYILNENNSKFEMLLQHLEKFVNG